MLKLNDKDLRRGQRVRMHCITNSLLRIFCGWSFPPPSSHSSSLYADYRRVEMSIREDRPTSKLYRKERNNLPFISPLLQTTVTVGKPRQAISHIEYFGRPESIENSALYLKDICSSIAHGICVRSLPSSAARASLAEPTSGNGATPSSRATSPARTATAAQ